MYCPRCKRILDEAKCPFCKKPTREVQPDDLCLLTEQRQYMAEMLGDVLEQNGINSMRMGALGAGLSAYLGANVEFTKVYTLYSDRERALELMEELFSGAPIEDEEEGETAEGENGENAADEDTQGKE